MVHCRYKDRGNSRKLPSHFSRVRLCDPIDGSPTGSPVPGILQARTLEWVAISFSNVLAHEINFWGNGYLNNPAAIAAAAKSLQSCPTLRPHRRQPNRLPRPWDSPGKNTGVWMWFGALPGAFGLGRAQPQRRGTSP